MFDSSKCKNAKERRKKECSNVGNICGMCVFVTFLHSYEFIFVCVCVFERMTDDQMNFWVNVSEFLWRKVIVSCVNMPETFRFVMAGIAIIKVLIHL